MATKQHLLKRLPNRLECGCAAIAMITGFMAAAASLSPAEPTSVRIFLLILGVSAFVSGYAILRIVPDEEKL